MSDSTTPAFGPSWGEKLSAVIDAAMIADPERNKKRDYLGASTLGEECDRKLAYYYFKPADEGHSFEGRTLRIFDMGHDGEKRMESYLKSAKFEIYTAKEDGNQFGFMVANGKLRGHIDGVITDGPLKDLPYSLLWENKCLGNKTFGEFQRKGIKESNPKYYAQANVYMAYMELEHCLFTALNRNDGGIHCELLHFDARTAQDASDKGVRVIQASSPEDLPRCASSETDFRCRMCEFTQKCWAQKSPEIQANPFQTPSWLKNATPKKST